jgi:hypothetical protein
MVWYSSSFPTMWKVGTIPWHESDTVRGGRRQTDQEGYSEKTKENNREPKVLLYPDLRHDIPLPL